MFTTTLNKIRQHNPCSEGWRTLLSGLGKTGPDDEPLPLIRVLETNGLEDAIWCLRSLEGVDREIRLFAVSCAREVQHLVTDPRLLAALDTSERFANGQATSEDLSLARYEARAASSLKTDVTSVDAAKSVVDTTRFEAYKAAFYASEFASQALAAYLSNPFLFDSLKVEVWTKLYTEACADCVDWGEAFDKAFKAYEEYTDWSAWDAAHADITATNYKAWNEALTFSKAKQETLFRHYFG